jgi:hypothetical protein
MAQNSNSGDGSREQPVASPCIGVCAIAADNLCEGCFRSLDEISQWALMSDQQRRETLLKTWQRARQAGKVL